MTTNEKQVIGFVGLGAMGTGMATSLVKAGFQVKGYDIDLAALETFDEAGGQAATSAAMAAEGSEALIITVVNAEQAQDVLFGSGIAGK